MHRILYISKNNCVLFIVETFIFCGFVVFAEDIIFKFLNHMKVMYCIINIK